MKKIQLLALIGILFLVPVGAQDNAAMAEEPAIEAAAQDPAAADQNQEAGKYERKSVSFINALWLLDASTRGMKPEMVGYMLNKVQQGISMKRFDYNPLPETMIQSFVDAANARDRLTIDNVASLMEEHLVPQIMKVLEAEREMRAANLLTDQQKNSFITDKAKELGVTGEQLEKIMNSAYLYLPVISDFALIKSTGEDGKDSWKCGAQVGILWYTLSTKGDQPKVTLRVKKMTRTFGFAKVKGIGASLLTGGGLDGYAMDGETVTEEQYAFRSMVKAGVKNLVVATQEMPEFKLSGQVLEVAGSNVGFDLGKNEGVRLDDKYRIMVLTEAADGTIRQEVAGWGIVSLVGDSSAKEGYKSKAQIIAGSPGIGAVLMEYPRLGIDIHVGYKMFPISMEETFHSTLSESLFVESAGNGFELSAFYNIGRLINISQLYIGFGWGLGSASASGSMMSSINSNWYSFTNVALQSFEVPLQKRIYFGRLAADLIAAYTIQQTTFAVSSPLSTVDISLANNRSGLSAGGNLEFAVTPSLCLNAGALYQMLGKSKDWEYLVDGENLGASDPTFRPELSHSGLSLRAGLTYSPAALPFDPWETLRGLMGW